MLLSKTINRSKILVIVVPFMLVSCDKSRKQSEDNSAVMVQNPDSIADSLVIEPEQFVKKQVLTEKDLYKDYDGGNELSKYFVIELIDRNLFLANRSQAVNFLETDTSLIQKKNGTLCLPKTNGGELVLTDKLVDNETHKEYNYLGQIKSLNAYLVSASYWEDWAFLLIDKKRGNTIQSFIGTPYLSADQKHIVSIDIDSFEGVASISLYAVTNDEVAACHYVDPIVEMYIRSWIPLTVTDNMYWSVDGYLYMPVVANANYWAADNNFYGLDQYIRLKPVA